MVLNVFITLMFFWFTGIEVSPNVSQGDGPYTVSNLHDATLIIHQRLVKRAADLHWLDVPKRVLYKRAVTVHRYLQHKAPQYLLNYCVPVSEVASRQHLRSTIQHRLLLVPRCRLEYIWPSGFPYCWSDVLELIGR